MSEHQTYMAMALGIAFDQMGSTSPNPAVGAVIVKNDTVISMGGTRPCGSDHAEVVALKSAREWSAKTGNSIDGAFMYVSLEPCNHHGKTPPCTEAIIASGIKRVYLAMLDPNPLVAGKGVKRLKDAGIDVVLMHEYTAQAADLLRPFKKYILRKRPYILNKSAITLDGRIAADTGSSQWISSEHSRFITHRLRARVDAIIVGKNTYLNDNPSLNVRLESFSDEVTEYFKGKIPFFGRRNIFLEGLVEREPDNIVQPLRVLIGLPEEIDETKKFFTDGNYIIIERKDVYESMAEKGGERSRLLEKLNIETVDCHDYLDMVDGVLQVLYDRGVMLAMLEGGGTLNGSFLDAGAIDQFLYIIAPKVLGSGLPVMRGREKSRIADSLMLHDISGMIIKNDIFYNGYRESYNFEMM
ncbi:MAG: riboflavin biosynthesis protein RibD [Spirochaetae bacterium HGW-Spirochaetae-1]|jgi:diaminohydroxyphosphoribosylaminopyrimidine deaminase/5-amino-6-(5-phosphoribosylamino)uracil reductase|nr:MAG: riboflavin biosynthesis protein RibD [Spirochaetae bacterium HGW-Spirochaetae-1]